MESLEGIKIKQFALFDRLRKVADLIYFERPLLSQYRSDSGANYLNLWCDTEAAIDRYLLFAVNESDLRGYLDLEMTLQNLTTNPSDGFGYFLDYKADNLLSVTVVAADKIPEAYLPSQDSWYEFDPECVESTTYSLGLGNEWSLEDLNNLPHDYSQVYSFTYALKKAARTKAIAVKSLFGTFPWRGGFSSMHFYSGLKGLIPKSEAPEIRSMHYASPGWIELELYLPAAKEIKKIVAGFLDAKQANLDLVKEIYDGLRQRNLVGTKGKQIQDQISDHDLDFCHEHLKKLAALLQFDDWQALEDISLNHLAALKILLSFWRRIKRLAVFAETEKVQF